MQKKQKIIVIVGPTASGKTSVAITLAQRFSGEVISADSRQVYRGLDIGTEKVSTAEMGGVTHHLIDVVDPMTSYSAADFKNDAKRAITEIDARDRLPIVAGGTFFYVDALLGTVDLPEVAPDAELRDELERLPADTLFASLQHLDPQRAETIDRHNKRRLIRALEIVKALGSVPSRSSTEERYEVLWLGIQTEKEELRARFAERATAWLAAGFLTEIDTLLSQGVSRERLSEIGFEYTLGLSLYDGDIDEEVFVQHFIEKNWQYAKRQRMWLKRNEKIRWFAREDEESFVREVDAFLK